MNLLKAIQSFCQGCIATAASTDEHGAGVQYGENSTLKPDLIPVSECIKYRRRAYEAEKILTDCETTLAFVAERENQTNTKLVAAREALRQIECKLAPAGTVFDREVHTIALDAYRATADDSGVVTELCTDACPFRTFRDA